jgi:hypothetical protein
MSLYLDPLEVTEEQKTAFMRSVIHNQPYTETLKLFGGNIGVTLNALTTAEQDYLASITEHVSNREDISTRDRYDFYLRSFLVMAMSNLMIGEKNYSFKRVTVDADVESGLNKLLDRYTEVSDKISSGELLTLLCTEAVKFNYRHRRLVSMGLNPDFWGPIQH